MIWLGEENTRNLMWEHCSHEISNQFYRPTQPEQLESIPKLQTFWDMYLTTNALLYCAETASEWGSMLYLSGTLSKEVVKPGILPKLSNLSVIFCLFVCLKQLCNCFICVYIYIYADMYNSEKKPCYHLCTKISIC